MKTYGNWLVLAHDEFICVELKTVIRNTRFSTVIRNSNPSSEIIFKNSHMLLESASKRSWICSRYIIFGNTRTPYTANWDFSFGSLPYSRYIGSGVFGFRKKQFDRLSCWNSEKIYYYFWCSNEKSIEARNDIVNFWLWLRPTFGTKIRDFMFLPYSLAALFLITVIFFIYLFCACA